MSVSYYFLNGEWWWVVVVSVLLGAGIVVWRYGKERRLSVRQRLIGILLRVGVFCLLGVCFLEPARKEEYLEPREHEVVILADRSESMQMGGGSHGDKQDEAVGRGMALVRSLLSDSGWQRLDEQFRVSVYSFGEDLRREDTVAALEGLGYESQESRLQGALETLRQRYEGRSVAGIVLLSDGNATDWNPEEMGYEGMPAIFPVGAKGGREVERDLILEGVVAKESVFEDAPVTVDGSYYAKGFRGEQVACRLVDQNGRMVKEEVRSISSDDEKVGVRFQFQEDQFKGGGLKYYRMEVNEWSEATPVVAEGGKSVSDEATKYNNGMGVVVRRDKGPYRVLYVGGKPNWEHKFLQRALKGDEELRLVSLIRMAKREAKMGWRGRGREQTNPLYRGFESEEEAEQYDEDVFLRINVEDELELAGGFPKRKEDLFRYDLLIFDDLDASFFTHEQMRLVRDFVSERGGGFMMLGGEGSFEDGGYEGSPIADVLPVYLNRERETVMGGDRFRFFLTEAGWLAPWMRLYLGDEDERKRLAGMPEFQVLNESAGVKPGASVLAKVRNEVGREYDAVVFHRYGWGKVTGVLVGDLWRWGFGKGGDELIQDMNREWRQLLRWQVTDLRRPLEVEVVPKQEGNYGEVTLVARVRNEVYEGVGGAELKVGVEMPGGKLATVTMVPSAVETGRYEGGFRSRDAGFYKVTASVRRWSEAGDVPKEAEGGWSYDPRRTEFLKVGVDDKRLAYLAEKTGGALLEEGGLESFFRHATEQSAVKKVRVESIWDSLWVMLVVFGLLFGEMAVRRVNGAK